MEITNLDSGRTPMSSSSQIITREEYNALMFELAQGTASEHAAPIPDLETKVRKLEFNMMILVGLILAVFILCRS